MILYRRGAALIDGKITVTDIVANHGRIIAIDKDIVPDNETEIIDCNGKFLLPALVDIHTHGANGFDFNTADKDGMKKILEFYISHGVGTVLPTVMTDSDEVICRQVALIAELAKDYPEIKGIHLEGPFLSKEFCGAQPVRYMQNPSFDKFLTYQKAAQGLIKLVTIAPELPKAKEFIDEAVAARVKVSLGHSGADHETVLRALRAGAVSFTHFGNGMSQMDRLNLNMVGSALSYNNAYAEVICDGKHVDSAVVRLLIKTKGLDKVIGVTDSMAATGLADGNYKLGVVDVIKKGDDVFVAGTKQRAGSVLDAHTGLMNIVSWGIRLPEAIKMWTINPAKMLGLDGRIGTIEVGKDADFIIVG